MKNTFRLLLLFVISILLSFTLLACSKTSDTPKEITYDKTKLELVVGDEFVLDIKEDVEFKVQGDVVRFNEETKTITAYKSGNGSIILVLKANSDVTKTIAITVVDKVYTIDELIDILKNTKATKSFNLLFELKDGGAIVYYEEVDVRSGKETKTVKELQTVGPDATGDSPFKETKTESDALSLDSYKLLLELDKANILDQNITKDGAILSTTKVTNLKYFDKYNMAEPKIVITLASGKVSEMKFDFIVGTFFGTITVKIDK